MKRMQLAIALAAAVGLAAAAPGLPNTPTVPAGDHFRPPSSPLTIIAYGDEADSMFDVLVALSASADQNVTVSKETRIALESRSPGLLADIVIPPEEAHSFVSSLLFQHGFLVSELRASDPGLLTVHGGNSRGSRRFTWTRVPFERIDEFRRFPAFLVETVVTFEHLDVRQMTTSLRALLSDNQSQMMLNVGSSSSVILRGPAACVADLLDLMKVADVASGELQRKRAEEAARNPPAPTGEKEHQSTGNPAGTPAGD